MPDIPASYTAAKPAMDAAAATSTGPKTLVCIFLFGGADTHNMLVPVDGANRTIYDTWRPSPAPAATSVTYPTTLSGVGIGETPTCQLGTTPNWRLHPKLGTNHGPAAKSFYSFWQDNQMAIVRSVGTLNRPTSRAEYLANQNQIRPDQLFAHNIQQDIWQAALRHRELRTTGWFGRTANLMDPSFNPAQLVESSGFSTSGRRLQQWMYGAANPNIIPPTQMNTGNTVGTTNANSFTTRLYKMYHATTQTSPSAPTNAFPFTQPYSPVNNLHNAQRDNFIDAIRTQEAVNTNLLPLPGAQDAYFNITNMPNVTDGNGVVRSNPFRTQLQAAARAIYSRTRVAGAEMDQQRQVIMVSIGGWDNHLDLRNNMDWLLESMSVGLAGFWRCLQDLTIDGTGTPLSETVAVFTETEFSRTFKANTTNGTDHAWAGHHFVIASPSNITRGLYGIEPDYTIGAGRDVDTNLGRYIPDVSIDQYYATLLRWFGVPSAQMPLILPNLVNFEGWDLGFLK
jgi:uncharacterized protein (DUF1501 family)